MKRNGKLSAMGIFALCAMSACRSEPQEARPLWTGPQSPGERSVVTPEWVLAWEIGEGDSLLLADPGLLTPGDTQLVWYDYLDRTVFSVSHTGELLWQYGSEGQGPLELAMVRGMGFHDDGTITALDTDNARVARISAEGEWVSLDPVPEGYWFDMSVLSSERLVLFGADPAEPFALWIPEAGSVERFGAPWDGYGAMSMLQRQGVVIDGPDGRWLFAFGVGNGWFPFEGREPVGYLGQSIEHVDFPGVITIQDGNRRVTRMPEAPVCTTCDAWIGNDTIHVLFGGYDEENGNRVIDQYRWSDGSYLRSIRLPHPASEAVRFGDLWVLLTPSPVPLIRAYRMVPAEPDG